MLVITTIMAVIMKPSCITFEENMVPDPYYNEILLDKKENHYA